MLDEGEAEVASPSTVYGQSGAVTAPSPPALRPSDLRPATRYSIPASAAAKRSISSRLFISVAQRSIALPSSG